MAEAAQPQPAPGSLKALILVLGACGFASTFTMRILDPLVPTLASEFTRSVPQVAAIATAFSFAYAVGQPFLGPVADSFGKLRTISTCLLLLATLSAAAAFAWSFDALTVMRTAAGIVAGGVIPAAMAAIGDRAPMAERQVQLGRFLVLMIVGQMAGAACSGLIATHIGWRGVFLVAGALAAIAGILVMVVLKPRPDAQRPKLSFSGALARYATVFANPQTKVLYGLVIIEGALVFGMPPYVAAILQERAGVGPSQAGIVIAGTGLGGIVYGILTRILVERLGPARMTTVGGALMALAYCLFALPMLPWWSAIAIFMLSGFGFFLMHGTFQALATELAPSARGSAVALFACALFCGHALGPLLMGTALHLFGTSGAILSFAAAVGLLGLLVPRVLSLGGSRT
ncbi:MAG: MFS transporter [Bosea sp.]|jgi:predicted MFS family arabinose efflux permease|uniref:MFS transporter n=1 Tax=Bosea sp. (in: a-proteobacteria) TaxID=1871050 RepID=UPI001AC0EFC5|nr:MFS transporter [Bosea sp. (in: a-proteobacteria)]MBN9467830.1 MFS transporter [Bosea sp. (in: a-proteobacteria)]